MMEEEKQKILDGEHLKLLTLFYWISGTITCFLSLIPVIHVIMGVFFIHLSKYAETTKDAPPAFIGWLFVIIGSLIIILGLTLGILKIFTGKFIRNRKHRIFCLIISGINCIFFPYGTALGVSSLIVLNRDSVKQLFLSDNPVKKA